MKRLMNKPVRRPLGAAIVLGTGLVCALAAPAQAGKVAWLDEVIQQAIRDVEVGGKTAAKNADEVAQTGTRLLVRETDDSLAAVARRSDDLARSLGRNLDEPVDAALRVRFNRLVGQDAEMVRTFSNLAPAERRLAVEMGETAQVLARRYPGQAEPMIRALGVDGLTAVRAYGPEVAEVIVREGPQSLSVLRKTGRAGWTFFNNTVLPNKGKLAAAGVLALFLANPEKFVDTAGQATQYAVEQFARAGIDLIGAVGGGAVDGLENALTARLAEYGLTGSLVRYLGMAGAILIMLLALSVLVGAPLRWVLAPVIWPFRLVGRLFRVRPTTAA